MSEPAPANGTGELGAPIDPGPHCDLCFAAGPISEEVRFRWHIGAILWFVHGTKSGRMCQRCLSRTFWRSQLITFFLGWWGVLSFLVTPFLLVWNTVNYFNELDERGQVGPTQASERALRFGWPAVTLGLWVVVGPLVLAGSALLTSYLLAFVHRPAARGPMPIPFTGEPSVLTSSKILPLFSEPPWWTPIAIAAPAAIIGVILAVLVIRRARSVASGTSGRARLLVLAWATIVQTIGYAVITTVWCIALTDPGARSDAFFAAESLLGESSFSVLDPLVLTMTAQGTYPILWVGIVVLGAAFAVALVAALASWLLIPREVRLGFWAIHDIVLLVAFVAVTLLLPLQPLSDAQAAATLPAIRLAVTTWAGMRLLFRLIPPILDLVERVGFRLLVAARLMRARKSGFLTFIGGFSILAVLLASCVLTTTLSVMGGFRNDLKQKILGNNAHVLVDRSHGTFERWEPTLRTVRRQPNVVAASPYVSGEVMITSATNLSGAILRGIDPQQIGRVTDLRRNMRHGRLSYLSHPERLLHLSPSEMGRGLLAPPINGPPEPPPPPFPERGSELRDMEDSAHEIPDPDGQRVDGDIEPFLLPEPESPAAGEEREVLPGLIVGQELARTLRLHVGDEVDVVSPFGELGPSGPMPKTRPFRIAGIFYSGMYEFDMKVAYATIEDAQRFLNLGRGINGIEVKVADPERAETEAHTIRAAIGRRDLRVRAWQETNRNLFGALQLEKLAMFIMLGLAIVVASFLIVGSLTIMVQEKGKEVGILKAMGASGEQIVAVFMAQGLGIGLLGAALGLGLGYVACFAAEHFGIALNPQVYYIDKLPVHIDPTEFALVGIAAVVVSLLATIYPAVLGSRLRPIDALRYS